MRSRPLLFTTASGRASGARRQPVDHHLPMPLRAGLDPRPHAEHLGQAFRGHHLGRFAEALGRNIYQAPLAVDGPQEVRSAAKAFNAMQQRLIDSFGERTRLLSAVSHDLRSPLTRLRLRAEMLPDPRWRERLRGDLDEMAAMVRPTLDAVQGIEITEPRQRIDIDSMLAGLAEDARDAGHAARIEGHAGAPYPGFARNLKRGLQNLLDNAIRHGGAGEDEVSIHVDEHGGSLALKNRVEDGRIAGLDAALVLPR